MQRAFDAIFKGWENGVSPSDLYHQILEWIMHYQYEIPCQELIEDILDRMEYDSQKDIVADFVYGECYQPLRIAMGRTD